MKRFALLLWWMALCAAGAAHAQTAALPADSVYQLPVTLKDQDGNAVPFASLRGQVRVVTMFYTQCSFACPLTIETMKALRARLSPQERDVLQMLLVSLDYERDAVAALKKAAQQRELEPAHWTLTRAEPADVRKIAAVLGVQYKQLVDMEINHSSVLTLLDAQGRIRAKTNKVTEIDPAFFAAVKATLADAAKTRQGTSRAFGT
jgi:protein SCO1/2